MKPTDQQKIVAAMAIGYRCEESEGGFAVVADFGTINNGDTEEKAWSYFLLPWTFNFDENISKMVHALEEKKMYPKMIAGPRGYRVTISTECGTLSKSKCIQVDGETLSDALILAICAVEESG